MKAVMLWNATDNATKAGAWVYDHQESPIDSRTYVSYPSSAPYEYLNWSTYGHEGAQAQNLPVSLWADQRILTGAEFDVLSDAREKTVIGRSHRPRLGGRADSATAAQDLHLEGWPRARGQDRIDEASTGFTTSITSFSSHTAIPLKDAAIRGDEVRAGDQPVSVASRPW